MSKEIKPGDTVVVDYLDRAKFGHAITEIYTRTNMSGIAQEAIGVQFEDGARDTAVLSIVTKITYVPK
tara:strand:+ start:142 stop:345 length:204 start_codon:yes stop_codon:yes gene_type:complete